MVSSTRTRGRLVLGGLVVTLLLALAAPSHAQSDRELVEAEYRVKAAFLYKFGGYIEWPADAFADPASPLVIGVIDADPLATELGRVVVGRTIAGRSIEIQRLRADQPLTGAHVIFVGRAARANLPTVLAAVRGRATLIVTEDAEAMDLGSMINFVVVDDKVRFDVALPPAAAGSLKISARLLGVARRVFGGPS